MRLAAFMLLFCAQEAQRSGRERAELVRTEVHSSALARDAESVRDDRDMAGTERLRRSRQPGFLDVFGGAYDSRPGPGDLGASFVLWPGPDEELRAGERLEAELFGYPFDHSWRASLGEGSGRNAYGGEDGHALLPPRYDPAPPNGLFATVLVDSYDPDHTSSQPALTQLSLNAIHRTPEGHGLGLFAELTEFDDRSAAGIAGPYDDRFGVDAWLALGSSLQLYGRAEQWSDRGDSGESLRARAIWQDALGPGGALLLETYRDSDDSSHTTGLRAAARKRIAFGAVGLSWDATDNDLEGTDEKLLQHAVRADVDFALGRRCYLGVYAESQFGDETGALALGFALRLAIE